MTVIEALGTAVESIKTWIENNFVTQKVAGTLDNLNTEDKTNLVAAINEAAASGGDGIPVPENATVGQTIIVKEVDESGRPIKWEMSNFPESNGSEFITVEDIDAICGANIRVASEVLY